MSNYGTISVVLDGKINYMNGSLSGVKKLSFDGVWSGPAHDALTGSLDKTLANADTIEADLKTFSKAMNQLNKYKKNKEKIADLQLAISKITIPDDEKGAEEAYAAIAELEKQIKALEDENKILRAEIEGLLSSIGSISSSVEAISYNFDSFDEYIKFIIDIYELKAIYEKSGALRMMGAGDSLYNYYNSYDENGNVIKGSGKAYVEGIILDIQEKYSGREASVNSALAILQLAANAGIKINYEHAGTSGYDPYVPTSAVATGVDCNPFVSWCLDKGVPGGFQWRPVGNFTSIGTGYSDWTQAQPGDVLANGGHVSMIVENDVETGTFVIAEASGSLAGIRMKSVSYQYLKGNGYTCRDMSQIYNGTVNTDRWDAFSPYVNPSTFQRKV